MTIDDITKRKIWDAIMESRNLRTEMLPHERNKTQLLEQYNISREQVDLIIKSLLKEGTLISRPALYNGRACIAYSFKEGSWEDILEE